jgi:AcrR family transcriptional regulator
MYSPGVDTRERLVESARELLWERGYVGTSPKAIQQRADAGQGSMYHHFSGKAELALAAIERSAEELLTHVERQLAAPGSAIERIAAYLLRERDVLRGCRIGRLTQDPEIIADPDLRRPLDETFDRILRDLARVLAEGQANGELAAHLDPAQIATTLLATLQGGYVLARAADSTEPFERAVTGAVALLTAARPAS